MENFLGYFLVNTANRPKSRFFSEVPKKGNESANSTQRRPEHAKLTSKTAVTHPTLAWVHGVWVLTSLVAPGERCREFGDVPPPPPTPEKSCSTTEKKTYHLEKNYLRAFLVMQEWHGRGDNYGAFNGNLGVSFSDVNRDVKTLVSVEGDPPCRSEVGQ